MTSEILCCGTSDGNIGIFGKRLIALLRTVQQIDNCNTNLLARLRSDCHCRLFCRLLLLAARPSRPPNPLTAPVQKIKLGFAHKRLHPARDSSRTHAQISPSTSSDTVRVSRRAGARNLGHVRWQVLAASLSRLLFAAPPIPASGGEFPPRARSCIASSLRVRALIGFLFGKRLLCWRRRNRLQLGENGVGLQLASRALGTDGHR